MRKQTRSEIAKWMRDLIISGVIVQALQSYVTPMQAILGGLASLGVISAWENWEWLAPRLRLEGRLNRWQGASAVAAVFVLIFAGWYGAGLFRAHNPVLTPRLVVPHGASPRPRIVAPTLAPVTASISGKKRKINLTFRQFNEIFAGHTEVQNKELMKPYIDGWLAISGTVFNVDGPLYGNYTVSIIFGKNIRVASGGVTAIFNPRDGDDVAMLAIGQRISALCQVYHADKFGVRPFLSNCELVHK